MVQDGMNITLIDSEGSEIECELLDRIEYCGGIYCVLLPIDDDSAEEELIILKEGANGELMGFDDTSVLDTVFGLFIKNTSRDS